MSGFYKAMAIDMDVDTLSGWDEEPSKVFKVVLLGNSGVGKTCICQRLNGADVNLKTQSTVGVDYVQKHFIINGELVRVSI